MDEKEFKLKSDQLYEIGRLEDLVKLFSQMQIKRLTEKQSLGWCGWDSRETMKTDLIFRIIKNVLKGDWVDVANLVMFAWHINYKSNHRQPWKI